MRINWYAIWENHLHKGRQLFSNQKWFMNPPETHPSEKELQVIEKKIDTVLDSVDEINTVHLIRDFEKIAEILGDYREICVDQNHKTHASLLYDLEGLAKLMTLYWKAQGSASDIRMVREDILEYKERENSG
tara:strand:- start:1114 stop:1509 length:396 start_codon:yes stop_codon:yes gene_type:complete